MKNSYKKLLLFIYFHSQISYSTHLNLQPFKTDRGGLKKEFLIHLKECFNKEIFFETGTSSGDTTEMAVLVFNEVYSTELSEKLYKEAIQRLNNNSKAHLYLGDSAPLLNKILPALSQDIIFWIDAHYCGVGTGRGNSDSPILEELEAIQLHNKENSIIMIDDLRGFYSESWPQLSQIILRLKNINPDYIIIAFGDALIAYPKNMIITESDCLKACSVSRFFDTYCFDYTINDVLKAEEIIAATTGAELDALHKFFTYINGSDDQYGILWQALIFDHNEQYEKAYNLFSALLTTANQRGINHWRIHWYLAKTAFKLHNFDTAKNELEIVIRSNADFNLAHELLNVINIQHPL